MVIDRVSWDYRACSPLMVKPWRGMSPRSWKGRRPSMTCSTIRSELLQYKWPCRSWCRSGQVNSAVCPDPRPHSGHGARKGGWSASRHRGHWGRRRTPHTFGRPVSLLAFLGLVELAARSPSTRHQASFPNCLDPGDGQFTSIRTPRTGRNRRCHRGRARMPDRPRPPREEQGFLHPSSEGRSVSAGSGFGRHWR